jgi:aldose 1-epimerase
VGRGGTRYDKHHGFCLETQKFPDSANRPHFPSVVLRPGERYSHVTVHTFGASAVPPTGEW